jgi:hypothetical protein
MRAEPAGADGTSRFAAWIAPVARSLPSSVIAAEVSPRAFRACGLPLAVRPAGSAAGDFAEVRASRADWRGGGRGVMPEGGAGLPVARYLRPEEQVVPFRARPELGAYRGRGEGAQPKP